MTDEERFEYWKSYAERDLDAAGAMYSTGRWFYTVFMCQQAVEKLVKGLYTIFEDVYEEITELEATDVLNKTKEVYAWLLTLKTQNK